MERYAFIRRQHPDADTIPVRRRLLSARMEATRFAAVFDIHPEQASPRRAGACRASIVAHAGEGDLVGGRSARLRSGYPVARIAKARVWIHDPGGGGTVSGNIPAE